MNENELKFKVPGPDDPGYLKRQRRAAEYAEALRGKEGPEVIDELAEWLAEFVDGDEDLIWEASREQINTMLAAIRAENINNMILSGEADAGSENG